MMCANNSVHFGLMVVWLFAHCRPIWRSFNSLNYISCNIQYWAVCIQLIHFSFDHCENTCTWSYYHHQIGSITHLPLFRVRSWNMVCDLCLSIFFFLFVISIHVYLFMYYSFIHLYHLSLVFIIIICLSFILFIHYYILSMPHNQCQTTQLPAISQLLNTNLPFFKQKWHVLKIWLEYNTDN